MVNQPQITKGRKFVTIALAGQPNVGKSTVFNMLTGLSQHVGNWPGKTVEQKTGQYTHAGQAIHLVDLPGTYSLTANSEEECITRNFILRERPDVVIVIVNAAALERNLYLVAELLILPVRIVLGLNMVDVARQQGVEIEPHVLEAALGVPVVPLVASRNQGVHELVDAALRLAENPVDFAPARPEIRPSHRPVLDEIRSLIAGKTPSPYPEDWAAIKLLEGDAERTEIIHQAAPEEWEYIHALLKQHEDAFLDVAGGRYEWIGRMVRAAISKPRAGVITLTDRLDRVATHPFWGLMVLLGIFGLIFWLTYTVAMPFVGWLDTGVISRLAVGAHRILVSAPHWLMSLVVDGLIGGVGMVLALMPVLVVFFAILGLLEDVGDLARSAYVMDRFMHWMGLHGRSFLPLFIGFGCNVPAVMGARIVEERRARLLTILLTPLVPCTARMAVIAFLAPAFFGERAALITWGLVTINIIILAFTGIVLNRVVFKGAHAAFIMEMPLYHLPNARTIGLFVWNNTWAFIKKAGTIILFVSVLVWALAYLPAGDIQTSLLARMGRWLEPLGRPMGLADWRLVVTLLSSFIAKENTIAVLGILYSAESELGLAKQVSSALSPAAALAFLVVQMTFIPCVATVAAIKQEIGWRWAGFSVGLLLMISLCFGILAYQVALLAGL
ncbi:MAG: ferrous iron transport protein B [Anaerolineales bacterium]|nr:ferrous iron transport protein B [Anaerolineales bacterium]